MHIETTAVKVSHIPSAPPTQAALAVADIASAIRRWPVVWLIGVSDIASRYRRTMLGQFWITLSNAFMILAIGFVWSQIWRHPIVEFLPYLAVGQVVWLFMTGMLTDASMCFVSSTSYLKELALPRSTYLFSALVKNLIIFGHNIIIVPLLFLIFGINPGFTGLLFVPAFLITIATLVAVSFWLSILGLRYRDVPSLIGSVIMVMFFLTPVIWRKETMATQYQHLLIYNPFSAFLDLMRSPLLGTAPEAASWLIAIAIFIVNAIIGFLVYARFRKMITYWL